MKLSEFHLREKQHDGASTQRINQNKTETETETETWEHGNMGTLKEKKKQIKKDKKDAEGGEQARSMCLDRIFDLATRSYL